MKPLDVDYIPNGESLLNDPFYAFLYGLWFGGVITFNLLYWRLSK